MPSTKNAIATITDRSFIQGTITLFHSILKHNPSFNGDFVVICEETFSELNTLKAIYPQIKCWPVDSRLLNLIKMFGHLLPRYHESTLVPFYSLEIFRMEQYDAVYYIDSDIICLKDFMHLLSHPPSQLLVTPDYASYRDLKRHPRTYETISPTQEINHEEYIQAFSCGTLLASSGIISESTYQNLLKLLTPLFYKDLYSFHTDSFLLNHYFKHNHQLLSSHYNYILHGQEAILAKEKVRYEEAVFLHYSRYPKPWESTVDMQLPWIQLWQQYYKEALEVRKIKS